MECTNSDTPFSALSSEKETAKTVLIPPSSIVLKNRENILALSGILGGDHSKFRPSSTLMYVEAAEFDPKTISLTGQKTRLMTGARRIFERGIDGACVKNHLIQVLRWMGFSLINIHTAKPYASSKPSEIALSVNYFKKFTGCNGITAQEMSQRLSSFGFQVKIESQKDNEVLYAVPALWRKDIQGAPDLIEEILRFKGWYQEVPMTFPLLSSCSSAHNLLHKRIQDARTYLMHHELGEAVTWSFISANKARLFSTLDESVLSDMTLINPIAKDMAVMRPSMLPNLVDLALWHIHNHLPVQARFEWGPVFFSGHPKGQKTLISGVFSQNLPTAWGRAPCFSFFDLKRLLEGMCMLWGKAPYYVESQLPWMHPGQCASIWVKDRCVGFMGKIHPRLTEDHSLMAFEVDPEQYPLALAPENFVAIVPPIEKELSFFLDSGTIGNFLYELKQQSADLIDVCLLDCFEKENRTSISVRCTFQPKDRSWSGEEIHQHLESLVRWAHRNGALLRGNALFSHL
ncbi:phenylalanine--tRNA ligase beta subunit-related protein [Holospora elegans]|uniref:phenylalanine--tRNA ligase beta subunit-related protein n=1 Tax=Holospora elegans TaxID=431043 RepID=UPI001FA7A1A8|nr:phenylalanine--tRNA ligase beta subunit-related protein [Holospora elegans]